MVIYRTPDGNPGYHQAESLTESVERVEHLRNDDGVEQARIFRLEEVAFEYRPYFRVEIAEPEAAPPLPPPPPGPAAEEPAPSWTPPAPEAEHDDDPLGPAEAPPPPPPPGAELDDEPLGAGARRGLFGR
jgi:hypothetical protein